jgi:4-hydroxybenzoyl-CoA reductase subunit beta
MKTHSEVVCRVATSSPKCLAVASADTVPALIALGARIKVVGPRGDRIVDLGECYRDDGINYLALAPGEIVTEVVLPPSDGWRSTYLKQRDRNSFDFPIAGVAAAVRWDGGIVSDARIAITALGSRPVAVDASALRGTKLDDDAIGAVADAAHKAARPMDNTSGTISQRKRAARVFAERALRSLRDGQE